MTYNVKHGNPGRYNASLPTIPDGEGGALAIDANGRLITVGGSGASANQVQGTAADNAASTGNPVLTGAEYNASAPTYADGDVANNQADVNGNLKVREQYAPGYEDNTANVAKVEHRYTFSRATADAQVKAGAGFLHTLTFACSDAAPTAGSITVYDSLTETGTVIYSETFDTTAFRGYTVTIDSSFGTGLYIGFTTTADVAVTASYR